MVRIICHADLQALEDRSDKQLRVELVSLESVRIASDSCALLRDLLERKSRQMPQVGNVLDFRLWKCPQIDLLSLVAGVSLEFHKIKHDLYPLLAVQEAKLEEGGFLNALLLMRNSAVALVHLAKKAKEILESCVESDDEDEVDDDALDEEDEDYALDELGKVLLGKQSKFLLGQVGKVEEMGKVLKDTADLVLKGTHNIAWLKSRLPSVLEVVDALSSTRVVFPHGL